MVDPQQRPGVAQRAAISVFMVTWIVFDSMDEVTRKKKPIDLRKNELRGSSSDQERLRLSWRADNLPSFPFFAMFIRRWKSFFTVLFMIGRAVDRPFYRLVYCGDRTYSCGDIAFSSRRPSPKLVCTNSLGIEVKSVPQLTFHKYHFAFNPL